MESKTKSKNLVQQCWKMMLEKPQQMQKMKISKDDRETSVGNRQREDILIAMEEDMQGITFSDYLKNEKQTKISIFLISDVLSGENLPEMLADGDKSRSFALVIPEEKLIFVTPSEAIATTWILGLQRLIDNQKLSHLREERRREWFREVFLKFASSARDYNLKFNDIFERVFNSKHITITRDFFTQKLKEFLKMKKMKYNSEGAFSTREQFEEFCKYIFDREDILNLIRRIASNGISITPSDLEYFLKTEQSEKDVTLERCEEIIRLFEVTQTGRERLELQVQGFTHFLLSSDGELFNKAHELVYQDMSQPLPHYYIASSHNTYLCGAQLRGESSAKIYKSVIEKGCRCVELDCWDGDDGEPIVYHGHTLTSKVLFKDIVKAIDESAFKISPYPLIMSLENHCSIEVQKKMAKYLKEILGEKLYKSPVDKNLKIFPSPDFFKYKILIRGKIDNIEDDTGEKELDTCVKTVDDEDGEKWNENKNHPSIKVTPSTGSETNSNVVSSATIPPVVSPLTRRRSSSTSKMKKVAKELSDLINYLSNSKFLSYADSFLNGKFYQSSSFVERDMESHVQNNAEAFIGFNMRQISRIYPGGLRIESSNYNPQKPWNVGCQIVALNHQTNDEPMHFYYGKFRQNGKAGYILKPIFLRDPSYKFNPINAKPNKSSKILKLKVLSGQQLPAQRDIWSFTKDEPDPYVQIQVRGVPADVKTVTTSTIMDNSFNPAWNERFEIKVLVPELAMIRFSVYDSDIGVDDFIGQHTIPFESMQQGYRHIPLLDMDNKEIPCASIFVHVAIEDLL